MILQKMQLSAMMLDLTLRRSVAVNICAEGFGSTCNKSAWLSALVSSTLLHLFAEVPSRPVFWAGLTT